MGIKRSFSLILILDADKEGFLRSTRSLIQTCGRASRNLAGKVILYADTITRSMQQTMDETSRRREIQNAHNVRHDITPERIVKEVTTALDNLYRIDAVADPGKVAEDTTAFEKGGAELEAHIRELEKEMQAAARDLEFERAAALRDRIVQHRRGIGSGRLRADPEEGGADHALGLGRHPDRFTPVVVTVFNGFA